MVCIYIALYCTCYPIPEDITFTHSHTLMVEELPCKALTTTHQERFGVWCLAQEHLQAGIEPATLQLQDGHSTH